MHIIGSAKAGGAEMFYLRLVQALAKECEVIPIVRKYSWMDKQLAKNNISHHTAKFGGKLDFFTKKKIANIIHQEKPHVIQTWMNRASSFLPKTEIPTVGRMGGYYNLKYYRNNDYIVGNTHLICDYVKKQGFNSSNIDYLPNFIPEPEKGYEKHRQGIRKQYNIKETDTVLIMAGRLHENKAIDVAIKALELLPNNQHLILVGEGPLRNNLEKLAKSKNLANRVHFVGWQSNISPFAGAADIWIAPSRHEPLGNIVLDAWAHKMPVIAASVDGPKVLINHGKNGLLFTSEIIQELADNITKLTKDPKLKEKLALAGYAKFQKNFSEEVVIKKYLEFYKKITN